MSQSRQLAAIMFTDIVGYTALMGQDEQKAFELLMKNRAIQKPIIEQYHGRWIKELGDGVMASFNSVTDAANAAIKIQEACNATNEFKLRIGIHLGDVVFENDDVFGDGVNLAARIQAQAPVGGIWVSESVQLNLVNKNEITTEFVKTIDLKNVKDPVRVYEIKLKSSIHTISQTSTPNALPSKKKGDMKKPIFILLGILILLTAGYLIFNGIPKVNDKYSELMEPVIDKSIAVLPFVDMSPGKDQEYFSDGLSEELLNLLSKIADLKVIGRTSSFSFKGKNEDLRSIAQKLGVAHILEGSVRKDGNQIRVTAQLIKATDGSHLWSDSYDRDLEGIFKLQDDIAGAVVKQLKLKLFTANVNITSSSTNTEVYNLILQGNYFVEKRNKENFAKALKFYMDALSLDSLNARAWAGVAKCNSLQAQWVGIDRNQGYEKARIASKKAIALDDSQAEGYRLLGEVKMFYDFDWDGAETEFQKALKLEPGNADVVRILAYLDRCLGRLDEALRLHRQSIDLDPIKSIQYFTFGQLLYYANHLEEAIVSYKKVLDLNPQFPHAHIFLGMVYLLQGKPDMALAEMLQTAGEDDWKSFGLILTYEALGRKKEVNTLLSDYLIKFQKNNMYQLAEIYAVRREKDKAFEYLEKSYLEREARFTYLKGDPLLKNLESDPRHTALLKKMKLPVD